MKKTGFNSYVYDFSVDHDAITVDDILDIHNYLMKKNVGLLKNLFFCRISKFINLNRGNFSELYFNEKSRM